MKKNVEILGTLTDYKGRKNKIIKGKDYAIIYRDIQDFGNIKVDTTACLNYDHDGYIGHDDCEGRAYGPRFIFDETPNKDSIWSAMPTDRIIAVTTPEEINEKLIEIFG